MFVQKATFQLGQSAAPQPVEPVRAPAAVVAAAAAVAAPPETPVSKPVSTPVSQLVAQPSKPVEAVLSVRRPLRVQQNSPSSPSSSSPLSSPAAVRTDPPKTPDRPEASSPSEKKEFYHEETIHHAHVTMETTPTCIDVLVKTNWLTFSYFASLVTGAMFSSLGAEIPVEWMIPLVSVISIGLFMYLRL